MIRARCLAALAAVSLVLVPGAFAQTSTWPSEAPPRPLAAHEVRFPPYEPAHAAQRHAGGRGPAPRAAGGQHAADRARGKRPGSRRESRRRFARGHASRSGNDHPDRGPDRRPHRLGGRGQRHRGRPRLVLRADRGDERQLRPRHEPVGRRNAQPVVCGCGDRAPAPASAVGVQGQLRRPRIPGEHRLRPSRLRVQSVWGAEQRHAGLAAANHARRPAGVSRSMVRPQQLHARGGWRRHRGRGVRHRDARVRRLGPARRSPGCRRRSPATDAARHRRGQSRPGADRGARRAPRHPAQAERLHGDGYSRSRSWAARAPTGCTGCCGWNGASPTGRRPRWRR